MWKPMADAPMDGTPIVALGYTQFEERSARMRGEKPKLRAVITRYHMVDEAPVYAVGWEYTAMGCCDLFVPLTWCEVPPL